MRVLRLFVALTAAAAMMVAPAVASAQETAFNGSTYAAQVAADGAIAHWRLGEAVGVGKAAEEINDLEANYNGAPLKEQSSLLPNEIDTSVYFDGVDDIAKVPNDDLINLAGPYSERTIELWFNADDPSTRQVLFEEGGGSRGLVMYVQFNRVWMNAWNLKNDDAGSPWGPTWISAPIEAGETYHAVMVVNGTTNRIKGFLNGSGIGQNLGVGNLFKHQAKVGIGAMWDDVRFHNQVINNSGTNFHFAGQIDEVALYNTALSQSTVQTHTVMGGLTIGSIDAVAITSPTDGGTVSGTVSIKATVTDSDDADGSHTVEARLDGGNWQEMTWNAPGEYYKYTWDTTTASDGSHNIQVRAYDDEAASKADSIDVTVDNTGAYGDTVLADGAVAYWRLGDSGATAVDELGNADGTYVGGPNRGAGQLVTGDADTAADFDGVDDYVRLPGSTDVNTGGPYGARTVELWFNADDVTSRQVLFEEGGLGRGLATYIDDGDLYVIAWNTKDDDATTPWGPSWAAVPVFTDTTYHLVLTLDATGDLNGYLNGLEFGAASGVGNLFGHSAKVAIGAMDDDVRFHDGGVTDPGQAYFFNGTIDEVAVYNTVLDVTTIGNHSEEGGESVNTPPLVVEIERPTTEGSLSGTVDVWIHGSDAQDSESSLTAQWRINGGTWNSTSWDGTHHVSTWDTTQVVDGTYTLEARVIDSESGVDTDSISVDVNNTSAYAAEVLSDSPVAYWRMGESTGTTAIDETGNNNATYVGGATLGASSVVPNESDTSVDFDGVDDYVSITNSADINTGGPYDGRTIELWFDADDITTRQVLFEEGGVTRGLSIYLDQGTLYATAWNTANDGPGTPWGPVTVSTTSHSANIWWQVVVVLDEANDELELYLDGTLVDSDIAVGELFSHSAKVALGAMSDDVVFFDGAVTNSGLAYFFNGQLDDVSIYNTALTSTQVFDHFTAGAGGLELEKL